MATIRIIDTGWHNLTRSGTQNTSKANSGSAITFNKTASIQGTQETSVESTPLVGLVETTAQPISFGRPVFGVSLVIAKNNTSDQELFKDIIGVYGDSSYPGLATTPGVKLLYVSGTADSLKTGLELYGSTSLSFHSFELTAGLPAVPGYVKRPTWTDSSDGNFIRVGFDFQVA